jgi:hypothetical protein
LKVIIQVRSDNFPMAAPQAEARSPYFARWSVTGSSLAAHGLLILAIGLLTSPRSVEIPPVRSIVVEVIGAAQFEAITAAAAAANEPLPAAPAGPAALVVAATSTRTDGLTTATALYARQILNDPANAEVRRTLATLERDERLIQLCNLEGLEQLRLARPGVAADAIVPYAFADMTIRGYTLDAPAGAFRSDAKWYAIAINCSVGPDYETVTDFRFRIGEPIPEDEWAAHNLLATEEDE